MEWLDRRLTKRGLRARQQCGGTSGARMGVPGLGFVAFEAMARRILVIEDEALIAEAVAARLRSEGYEVDVARDGLAGVERAAHWNPDLVLLDLMLPGLDGLEVCRRIQK